MRIAVAMSGGVDSLRTAVVMKESGHDVTGVHMRIRPDSKTGRRHAPDMQTASEEGLARLADWLSIPLVFVDLRKAFEEQVLAPFVRTYLQGLTPNPCVLCNPLVKFGMLLDQALRMGADKFATGHYARILPPGDRSPRYRLARGLDEAKDQSYFLFGLTQHQLAASLLPLGTATKREIAAWGARTPVAGLLSGESQEICFLPQGRYWEFLAEYAAAVDPDGWSDARGPIMDLEGRVLGEHKGIAAYTIGQRRGLGIASTAPFYVVAIEAETNTIRVGRAEDLNRSVIEVASVNWVSVEPPSGPFRARVRIRNQHRPAPALVIPEGSTRVRVRFDFAQRAVTPGQAAVIYDEDIVLGGGVIQPHS